MHPIDEEIARWQERRRRRENHVCTLERLSELSYNDLRHLAKEKRIHAAADRQRIIMTLYRQEYELDKRMRLQP